jgi:tRNA(Ile2) C34 agmatinyltransferase TiaS
MTKRIREVVTLNKAQCKKCGNIIESKHRHDFVWCKCGAIAVDGGKDYLKRCGESADMIEMSESYQEEYEANW